jgi:hypothetical protein
MKIEDSAAHAKRIDLTPEVSRAIENMVKGKG